jgi:hypothetical protein
MFRIDELDATGHATAPKKSRESTALDIYFVFFFPQIAGHQLLFLPFENLHATRVCHPAAAAWNDGSNGRETSHSNCIRAASGI